MTWAVFATYPDGSTRSLSGWATRAEASEAAAICAALAERGKRPPPTFDVRRARHYPGRKHGGWAPVREREVNK